MYVRNILTAPFVDRRVFLAPFSFKILLNSASSTVANRADGNSSSILFFLCTDVNTNEELDDIVGIFYVEIRQENGDKYQRSSLFYIRYGLNRHLRSLQLHLLLDACFWHLFLSRFSWIQPRPLWQTVQTATFIVHFLCVQTLRNPGVMHTCDVNLKWAKICS
jgi:hypothetical protein